MSQKTVRFPQEMVERDIFGFFDDFDHMTDAGRFTKLAADSTATVAASGVAGGVVLANTDTTDNNECSLSSTLAMFLFANGKPGFGETLQKNTETGTNATNFATGFSNTFGANLLVDNGAGPATNFTGALIYKVDGGTVWKTVVSNGTTQSIHTTLTTATANTYHYMRVEFQEYTTLSCIVTFWVDNVVLRDATTQLVIEEPILYASAAAMKFGTYIKTGSSNAEISTIDYMAAYQVR